MLNFDVKRKINTLRDILVGKVPDPKAQVEQITIALIYKFMDDMDLEGAEFGGNREFFTGDYEKYAWSEMMQSEKSGQERALLYAEGIEKMSNCASIPQLFRDIFRGAYIPYRDPETLNMFLKEISEFSYNNSEDLGNAFEYLLSIMGSQGDAGQFRTPRHIIDMMVEIIDPKKDETVLDPACGTAGFLISSYKHILENNKDQEGKSSLTADDRKRMTQNFAGYDISPDMVRLSRVNMYLHKFTKPNISEYDTLTSEEKWDDSYDVILANPPFMTPKGGVRPHNKFQTNSNKAELLFVDYILNHLNQKGRSAIIVPEGVIANNQSANIALRTIMVQKGLYAVLGLHEYVFKPYAGVSTFILLFDSNYKGSQNIYLSNIENDGFEKSENRMPISNNDIPIILEEVTLFKKLLKDNVDWEKVSFKNGIIITGEDYGENFDFHPNSYKASFLFNPKRIDELFYIEKGTLQSTKREIGNYTFVTAADEWGKHSSFTHECEALIFVGNAGGSLGKVHYIEDKFITSDLCYVLTPKDPKIINLKYYYAYFNANRKKIVKALARGVNKKAISKSRLSPYLIEFPDITVQDKIGSLVTIEMQKIERYKAEMLLSKTTINKLVCENK